MKQVELNKANFLKYGLSENVATKLLAKNFTVTKVQSAAKKDFYTFLTTYEIDDLFLKIKRQPIPDDVFERLIWETELHCCFCWNITEEKPVIIHHIDEYNKTQDNSYNNLVVLCLNHHGDVHTKREISQQNYSKMRLLIQKEKWTEALKDYRDGKRPAPGSEGSEGITVVDSPGAIVIKNNIGGQVAHTIINQKPLKRTFKPHKDLITSFLSQTAPYPYVIHILMNDMETSDLAIELKAIFDDAGWTEGSIIKGMGGHYPAGITVTREKETVQSDNVLEAIFRTGLKNVTGEEKKDVGKIGIYIGPNPDNYV